MNDYWSISELVYSPAFVGTAEEPVTLETVKEFLGLPVLSPPDSGKDAELNLMIAAAREEAEELWGSPIKLRQFRKVGDYWPCHIRLKSPLNSVDLFRYKDEDGNWNNLTLGTDYIIDTAKDPAIITLPPDVTWPTEALWPTSPIEVYFSAGYLDEDDIPNKIKQGILMLISHWFTNKVPIQSFAGQPQEVPYTVTRLLRGAPRP